MTAHGHKDKGSTPMKSHISKTQNAGGASDKDHEETHDDSADSRTKDRADQEAKVEPKSGADPHAKKGNVEPAPVGYHEPGHEQNASTHDDDKLLDADGKDQKAASGAFVKHKPSGKVGVLMHYDKSSDNPDGGALVHIIAINAGASGITSSPINCHLCDLEFMYR